MLAANPDGLRERVQLSRATTIVIDEIQKVPELLDVVHGLMVSEPGLRFAMTGSSSRKLCRGGANLLGGRAERLTMHPFMASELGNAFDLRRALRFGLLPLFHGKSRPGQALSGYVDNYLAEEVKGEGILRKATSFARFLEVASFSHGTIPNVSAIARECFVSQPTAATYFDILHNMLLAFSVPAFVRRARRDLCSKDKFYLCDSGIYQALRPRGFLADDGNLVTGMALEGLVAQHLRAWCDYANGNQRLYHWKTAGGVEVDFVVHGENSFAAFEVKLAPMVRNDHGAGLRAFGRDYPEAQLCLLYGGTEVHKMGSVLCLPIASFLHQLRPDGDFPISCGQLHG
jgi:predicted AAA+ superfamily ATPase